MSCQLRALSTQYLRVGLVKRKNKTRMCIDFCELNKMVAIENFPNPIIEAQIESIRREKCFTKLDLKNAFYHVAINEHCTKYFSFVTPMGQFEFLRMPFGYKISPSIFMRYVHSIFKQLMNGR